MAPPSGAWGASTFYIIGLLILGFVSFVTVIGPVLCGWGIYKISKSGMAQREAAEQQRLEAEYDRIWYCSKCATKFVW
jgi:hypothetical protein